MERKEDYIAKLETALHETSTKIDELKVQAALAKAEARDEVNRRIATLREQQAHANKKLEEARAAGEEVWQELRFGLEASMDDMKKGIKKAFDKLSN